MENICKEFNKELKVHLFKMPLLEMLLIAQAKVITLGRNYQMKDNFYYFH